MIYIHVVAYYAFPLLTAGMDFICMNLDWVDRKARNASISASLSTRM